MKLGMIGLPNVGKSTLFNAITNAGAQAANYPFCTIEPNVGIVADCGSDHELLTAKFRLKLKKVGKTYFLDHSGMT